MNRNLLPILLLTAVAANPQTTENGGDDEDDVPGRGVARISVINGDVSVRRGDSGDWTAAAINAPLLTQDRLLTGPGSRAEMQFDYANMIRVAADSEVRLADLENRRYIIQIARGLVTFRVLRDSESEVELSTPSISIRPNRRGVYRVAVREDGTTEVTVRSGEAEIFTPKGSERVRAGKTVMARGTQSDPEFMYASRETPEDDWDRWNERRDRDLERSRSYQYVSRDIYGAEDLDAHGRWVNDPDYGYVWAPAVAAGWAPYRAGRWAWADWYGWTWVSYDPWGWAPYHYGRWYHHSSWGWCWWPGGGPRVRHFWRPALVSFIGWNSGFSVGIGFGRVGWFPLAPREIYRPWYGGRYYGGGRSRVNIDNSVNVVNNVNITNVYRNARVNNAITAVDGADFSSGRVSRIHSVNRDDLSRASVVRGQVPVTPARESLRLADREVRGRESSGNDRFYSRREPARLERVSFDEQRRGIEQMTARRGGDEGVRGGGRSTEAVAGESGRRVGDNADRGGWRRVGGSENGARGADPASTTRRSGDNGGSAENGRRRGTSDNPAVSAPRTENSGSRRGTDGSDRGGWRRLGDNGGSVDGGRRGGTSDPAVVAPRTEDSGSRRATDSSDRGGRRGGTADPAVSAPRTEDSGSRRNSDGSDRGGWRRLGENGGSVDGGRRGGATDPAVVAPRTEDSGSRRGADGSDRGNWRRLGENGGSVDSGRRGGTADPAVTAPRNEDRGSRRGGDSSAPAATPRNEDRGSRQRSDNSDRSGWRRFGDPSGGGEPVPRTADRGGQRTSGSADRGGWSGFGDPSGTANRGSTGGEPRRSRDSDSGATRESRRSESRQWNSEGSPVRVNPPVVRERSSGSEGRRNYEPSGGGRSSSPAWGGGGRSSGDSSGGRMSGRSSDGGGRSSGGGGGWSGGGGGGGRSSAGGGGGGRSGGGGGRTR